MKKAFRATLAIFIAVVIIFGASPLSGFIGLDLPDFGTLFATKTEASSYGNSCGENVTWIFDEASGELTISGTGEISDWSNQLSIPWQEYTSDIKSIKISDGVKGIGDYSFHCCTALTKVSIPDSVKRIGQCAFYSCTSLTDINLPDSISIIDDYAFEYCTSLISIKIPDNVTAVNKNVFKDCSALENVILSYRIKSIGNYAFYNCTSLKNISIPSTTESIGDWAFYFCISLENIILPDNLNKIGQNAFTYCRSFTSIIIPDSVTTMSGYVFDGCSKLENVVLGKGIKSLGWYDFYDCDSLKNITIPDGVTDIYFWAFDNCDNLERIVIPDSVRFIEASAFRDCPSLTDVYYTGTQDEWNSIKVGTETDYTEFFPNATIHFNAVSGTHGEFTWLLDESTGELFISGAGEIYDTTPKHKTPWHAYASSIKSVTLSDSITGIGDCAFYDCPALESISMPDGITRVGETAFWNTGCFNNKDNWDNGVLYIDKVLVLANNEFSGGYTVKDGTKVIAERAFGSCNTLTNITLPESLTSISAYAFDNCSNLESIAIPDSVTKLNNFAFNYCIGLKNATVGKGITTIESSAFYCCWSLENVTISNNVTSIEDSAFRDCVSLKSIAIPEGVTSIGSYSFEDCDSLTDIIIPKGITYLEHAAFDSCDNLKSVVIPESLTTIGAYAFRDCVSLTDVYYDGTLSKWNKVVIYDYNEPLINANIHCLSYTLTYDVNGGSGNITEQTGDVNYTIGSTVPFRSGYNFLGWSTDKNSTIAEYVPGDTVNLTADTTLYAVWVKKSYLLSESDIFSFVNSRSNFKTGTYTMTDSDFIKLTDYISKMYSAKTAATYINRLQVARSDTWSGSCFGMSMSVILNKTGQIDFVNNFDPSAANMYGVARPYQNEAVQSAINYYQISQRVNGFRTTTYTVDKGNFSTGLEKLVNTVKDGNMTLLIYSWPEGCHAIVIVGYEKAEDGGHNLIAYDNRYGSKYINVYVDEEYNTCIVNGNEEAYYVEFNTDFSIFDKIDIDGPGNDMIFTSGSENIGTEIGIKLNGNITISNNEGETLTVNNGIIGGDMEVLSSYMIANSTVDDPSVPGILMLEVEDSDSFTFDSTSEEISASLSTDDSYAEINATADKVIISEDKGIYTTGDDIEFDGWLSLNNEMGDVINFEGQGKSEVNFLYGNGGDVIVEGANDECTLTVYSDLVDVDAVTFSSDYETLNISGEKDNIAITASSKNNGVFDIKVAGIGNAKYDVEIATPSATTINCGDSIILHAAISDIPEGGYVKWTASNDCFTYTVSEDGSTCKITSDSNGSTVFTVTIYDAEDNAVSKAEQTMNSKAGFFLKIIAFFKKLFGLNKTIPQIYNDIF